MKENHILLIGRSREIHRKIKTMGYRSTLMVESSKLTQEKLAPVYDRVIALSDEATSSEWVQWALTVDRLDQVTAVGAFTELKEKVAVDICRALGLPFHDASVIEVTHEKEKLRARLREEGLDDTDCLRIPSNTGSSEIKKAIDLFGYPAILKPANARGSLAVRLLNSTEEVDSALTEFESHAPDYDRLIERQLVGREFSVEAFSENGVHRVMAVTEKFKDERTSIELGHLVPARINQEEYNSIVSFVKEVLSAIPINQGPSHTELFLTAQGPRIVETHTRLGGDRIASLILLVSSVDIEELWIRQVAGESVIDRVPCIVPDLGVWAAVQYSLLTDQGRIQQVTTEDVSGLRLDGLSEIQALLKVGDVVTGEAKDSFSRAAEAIAKAHQPDQAIQVAQRALQRVKIEVVPVHE